MPVCAASAPSVLIVGSVNADLVLCAPRLPHAGESLIGTDYRRVSGGKGANQAVAVARLGASATFVGRTGSDTEGEELRTKLDAEGVRTSFLSRCALKPTGLAVITLDKRGRNAIVVIPGANGEVAEADVDAALRIDSYDALLVQLEIPPRTVIGACRLAEARGIPVVIDAGPAQTFPLERLHGVHVLTPNESETFMLTGIRPDTPREAQRAAEILLRRSHAKAVVLKLGERGALLCNADGACEHFPAYPVEAADTTAAGDAFTAALTVEYVQSRDLRRAVRRGNAAGALAAMTFGAQPSLPTASTVEAFCARQGAYVG